MRLQPGDGVLIYTDGVIDSPMPDGASFGEDRLRDLFAREHAAGASPQEVVRRLVRTAVEHSATTCATTRRWSTCAGTGDGQSPRTAARQARTSGIGRPAVAGDRQVLQQPAVDRQFEPRELAGLRPPGPVLHQQLDHGLVPRGRQHCRGVELPGLEQPGLQRERQPHERREVGGRHPLPHRPRHVGG